MSISKTIQNDIPAGTSIDFAGGTIPFGYLSENGQAVSKITYARLFESIGQIYGIHADPTLFYLPDSRGRVDLCTATLLVVGTKLGTETEIVSEAQMPSHSHTQTSHAHQTYDNTVFTVNAALTGGYLALYNGSGSVGTTTATNQNTGGGLAHNNMSPFLVTKKLIKY